MKSRQTLLTGEERSPLLIKVRNRRKEFSRQVTFLQKLLKNSYGKRAVWEFFGETKTGVLTWCSNYDTIPCVRVKQEETGEEYIISMYDLLYVDGIGD